MEYLAIIAFVGLIIFKAIKKSNQAKEEETGKTMLPGKQTMASRGHRKSSQPADSWEDWFTGDKKEQEIPVVRQSMTFTREKNSHFANIEKKKEPVHEQPTHCKQVIKLNSREEMRRAIIYSEILTRKY